MDKALPSSLDPQRLLGGPIMAIGVGFECDVQIPLTRSTDKRGLVVSVAETQDGPKYLLTVADGAGRALTAIIGEAEFPGFLELQTRQASRMRDLIVGPAEKRDADNG
jgi:hypothetical protein